MFGINPWEILIIGTAFLAVNVVAGLLLYAALKGCERSDRLCAAKDRFSRQ